MTDALTAHASPSDSSFSRDWEEDTPEQRESFSAGVERVGVRKAHRCDQKKQADPVNSRKKKKNQKFTASPPERASTPTSFNFIRGDELPSGPRRGAAPAAERAQTPPSTNVHTRPAGLGYLCENAA